MILVSWLTFRLAYNSSKMEIHYYIKDHRDCEGLCNFSALTGVK